MVRYPQQTAIAFHTAGNEAALPTVHALLFHSLPTCIDIALPSKRNLEAIAKARKISSMFHHI